MRLYIFSLIISCEGQVIGLIYMCLASQVQAYLLHVFYEGRLGKIPHTLDMYLTV